MFRRIATTLSAALLAASIASAAADFGINMPRQSPVRQGYDSPEAVKERMASRPLDRVEGLWQLAADQAVVAIELCDDPRVVPPGVKAYQVVIINSPRHTMRPGTVMGYLTPTARHDRLHGRLYTRSVRSWLEGSEPFIIKLTDDDHLSMSPESHRLKPGLRYNLNFLLRFSIVDREPREEGLEGFTRLYPTPSTPPLTPVYL